MVDFVIDAGPDPILTGARPEIVLLGPRAIIVGDASSLQGNPVSPDAPSTDDVLTWDGAEWSPEPGGGGGGVPEPFTPTTDPWQVLGRISSPSTGANSERFGKSTQATGDRATAFGYNAAATANDAVAIGPNSLADRQRNIAIGSGAKARSVFSESIAMGYGTICEGEDCIAIGSLCSIFGSTLGAIAIGGDITITSGNGESVVVGDAAGGGFRSTVLGALATAVGSGTAIGRNASAGGNASTALGFGASAGGALAIALGLNSSASHSYSIAIGRNSLSTAANRATIGKVGGSATEVVDLQVSRGFGAFGAAPPTTKPTVTGSRNSNPALASLITAIAATGLIADGTTP
jgi:hypothetical protein